MATLLAFTVAFAVSPRPAGGDSFEWSEVSKSMHSAREEWGVPGLVAGVVLDDKVVWRDASGTGLVDSNTPLTSTTLFDVGSLTKQFTATAAMMLSARGALDLDAPVKEWLPDLQFSNPALDEQVTLRDLLSHRTGVEADNLLAWGNRRSRHEVLERIRFLATPGRFRESFHYNNLLYTAAGQALGAAAGTTWDAFVESELFRAVGMHDSFSSRRTVPDEASCAHPHIQRGDRWESIPFLDLHNIGPGGSAVSTLDDLLLWCRALLSAGIVNGKQVLPREIFESLWQPETQVPLGSMHRVFFPLSEKVAYGLGWYVHEYAGTGIVEHGGQTDGMHCNILLAPERGIGVVVLTNGLNFLLPSSVAYRILDGLLNRDPEPASATFLRTWEQYRSMVTLPEFVPPLAPEVPHDLPHRATGTYHHRRYGPARVTGADGRLSLHLLDRIGTMHATADDRWVVDWGADSYLPVAVGPVEFHPGAQSFDDVLEIDGLGKLHRDSETETEGPQGRNRSFYLTMRDGVDIAVDQWLPEGLPQGVRIPAVIRATRYWRAMDQVGVDSSEDRYRQEADRYNRAGYALVTVDARGSGASFGFRPHEHPPEERADYAEIVDWITAQPWSNGAVGAVGVSYAGNTAEMMATTGAPGLRAIAPLFSDFDDFRHLTFPGGLLNLGFLERWSPLVEALDANDVCGLHEAQGQECDELRRQVSGVKPVDADQGRSDLELAVADHRLNCRPLEAARALRFEDDPYGAHQVRNVGSKINPWSLADRIEDQAVPAMIRVGWLDAATVNGALARFRSLDHYQDVVIGPWDHGGWNDADPFHDERAPAERGRPFVEREVLDFFDRFLCADVEQNPERPELTYYTLGSGKWSTTAVWPPSGFDDRRWYFRCDGELSEKAPKDLVGADRYRVDFDATTGERNRWWTNGGAGDVVYDDRRSEDRKLLTYTSKPMLQDMEITGHPLITLYLSSTHPDGALFVYLEDVSPEGRVTYITEGQLRLMLRRCRNEPSPYVLDGPYRTFRRVDAQPMGEQEIVAVPLELWATSVRIAKGHRIRIAVAGADRDTFPRSPRGGGRPTLTIQRTRTMPSHVVLPMKSMGAEVGASATGAD